MPLAEVQECVWDTGHGGPGIQALGLDLGGRGRAEERLV